MGAGIKAKTMTSLLILPALLAKVLLIFYQPRILLKAQSYSFFLVIELNLSSSAGLLDFIKASEYIDIH